MKLLGEIITMIIIISKQVKYSTSLAGLVLLHECVRVFLKVKEARASHRKLMFWALIDYTNKNINLILLFMVTNLYMHVLQWPSALAKGTTTMIKSPVLGNYENKIHTSALLIERETPTFNNTPHEILSARQVHENPPVEESLISNNTRRTLRLISIRKVKNFPLNQSLPQRTNLAVGAF
jgi:hypothetical protein